MLVSSRNFINDKSSFGKAITQTSQSSASSRTSPRTNSSIIESDTQVAVTENDKQSASKFSHSSDKADLEFSGRIWKSIGAKFTAPFSPGSGVGSTPSVGSSSSVGSSPGSGKLASGSSTNSSPSGSSNNNTKTAQNQSGSATTAFYTNGQSDLVSSNTGISTSERPPGAVDLHVSSNVKDDPLHTGETPNNFTIFTASNSRETAKATSITGEYSNFLIHKGITQEGKSLNEMLTSLNGQRITSETINAKLASSSTLVQSGSQQTAHLTGASLQKEFSASQPAQNGKGIILMGELEGTGASMQTDLKHTQEWMQTLGIKNIDVVHSEAEFEAKIKETRAAAETSGEKHDLLAYSVISHGNVADHNNNGSHSAQDKGYAYVDPGARYNEADVIGDMEHGAIAAENTVALFHTCNSGCFDTNSVASTEETEQKPSS